MADPAQKSQDSKAQDDGTTPKDQDATLEKALKDTFPASDPPASGSPTKTVGWEEPAADKKD